MTLIIDTLTHNPALAELYWERFGVLKNDSLRAVLERACARGQIRPDAPLDVLLDLLSGYVLYQLLIKPPSQAFQHGIDQVLAALFQGVAPTQTTWHLPYSPPPQIRYHPPHLRDSPAPAESKPHIPFVPALHLCYMRSAGCCNGLPYVSRSVVACTTCLPWETLRLRAAAG
ncbi:MAG: hypothetical protein Fur005_36440 [Roseiflexaceae bacterium]